MAIDLKRTWASTRLGRPILPGTVVAQEGVLLCTTIANGIENVQVVTTPVGTEKVLGFAYLASALPDRTSFVEQVTVPAAGSLVVAMQNQNIIINQISVYDVSSSAPLTPNFVPPFPGVPAPGTVNVEITSGKLSFAAGQAGHLINVVYIYSLTVAESIAIFGQRSINNFNLNAIFGQVEVGCGQGELYTDQFDGSIVDWTAGPLTLGPKGTITIGGAGPLLPAHVVAVPTVSIPMIGIRFFNA